MNAFGQKKVDFRGHKFNSRSVVALLEVERRLGHEFHIFQGSFSTAVGASSLTHAGGGAVDVKGNGDWDREVLVMREVGWVAWHRDATADNPEHIHGILRGDPSMHKQAKDQVTDWENGGDGLRGDGKDTGPDVDIPVFPLDIAPPDPGTPTPDGSAPIDLSNVEFAFRRGMKGKRRGAVERIQQALNEELQGDLVLDGKAGPDTKRGYRRYQKRIGLTGAALTGFPGVESLRMLGEGRWTVVD